MAAAATPITKGAARAVVERINQYGHGSLITALSHFGHRFDSRRGAGFGRGRRVLHLRALAFFAHAIAGGLLTALFLRLRLLRSVPGDLLFDLLPSFLRRLLFNFRRSLRVLSGVVRIVELRLQLREKFDGA